MVENSTMKRGRPLTAETPRKMVHVMLSPDEIAQIRTVIGDKSLSFWLRNLALIAIRNKQDET